LITGKEMHMKRYLPAALLACTISFSFQASDAVAADPELDRPMTYTERLCERVAHHVVETRVAELDLKAMNDRQIKRLKRLTFSSAVSACHDDAKAVYREMRREREGA
jgi:hypothetical protein